MFAPARGGRSRSRGGHDSSIARDDLEIGALLLLVVGLMLWACMGVMDARLEHAKVMLHQQAAAAQSGTAQLVTPAVAVRPVDQLIRTPAAPSQSPPADSPPSPPPITPVPSTPHSSVPQPPAPAPAPRADDPITAPVAPAPAPATEPAPAAAAPAPAPAVDVSPPVAAPVVSPSSSRPTSVILPPPSPMPVLAWPWTAPPTVAPFSETAKRPRFHPAARIPHWPDSLPDETTRTEGEEGNRDEFRELVAPSKAHVQLGRTISSILSPRAQTELTVYLMPDGLLAYRVIDVPTGKLVLSDSLVDLKLAFKTCAFRGQVDETHPQKHTDVYTKVEQGRSEWRPARGFERAQYREEFTGLSIWCAGESCMHCKMKWEWRLFDRGVAVRALVKPDLTKAEIDAGRPDQTLPPEWVHVQLAMGVSLPITPGHDALCWANINEQPYLSQACHLFKNKTMTPLTVSLPDADTSLPVGAYSVSQTAGFSYTQATVRSEPALSTIDTTALIVITKGEALRRPRREQNDGDGDARWDDDMAAIKTDTESAAQAGMVSASSWLVVIWGDDQRELLEESAIIRLLAPPTPARLKDAYASSSQWVRPGKLLRVRKFENAHIRQMIDFAAAHSYDYIHLDTGWYGLESDASLKATAVAPAFAKDMDLPALISYAHAKSPPVSVSLYVNDIGLKDAEELAPLYASWGVDAVKFGFVNLRQPKDVRKVHERVLLFGAHKMAVNVHDYYRPRSFARTWPHFLTQEGVRGQERTPDCGHHTILPFVRLLAGSADYTPRFGVKHRCSKAHQLALPIVMFSPIQSLFWTEEFESITQLVESNKELAFWEHQPTVWDDTRVLGGAIGQWVSLARRSGDSWFVGTVTGSDARQLSLDLRTLLDDAHPLVVAHGPAHPPLPALPADGLVLEVWTDGSDPHKAASEGQHLFLPSATVRALLENKAVPSDAATLPAALTQWAAARSIVVPVVDSFVLPAQLSAFGGHCMRIMPLQHFLNTHKD